MKQLLTLLQAAMLTVWGLSAQAGGTGADAAQTFHFYGVGMQNDGSHWSIELLVTGDTGQIAYPSVGCSGDWNLVKREQNKLTFSEHITEGADVCLDQGIVTLEPALGGRSVYTWYDSPGKILARAMLDPVKGKRLPYIKMLARTLITVDTGYMLPEFLE